MPMPYRQGSYGFTTVNIRVERMTMNGGGGGSPHALLATPLWNTTRICQRDEESEVLKGTKVQLRQKSFG